MDLFSKIIIGFMLVAIFVGGVMIFLGAEENDQMKIIITTTETVETPSRDAFLVDSLTKVSLAKDSIIKKQKGTIRALNNELDSICD